MKEYEAFEKGFYFTGACWSVWDKKAEEDCKAKAADIKKRFKGADFRIVSGSANGWLSSSSKAIFGNEIYNKVRYWKETDLENRLGYIEKRRAELLKQIEDLDKQTEEARINDSEIRELLKK